MPSSLEWIGGAARIAQVAQKNVASSTSGHTFIISLAYEDGTPVTVLTHVVDGVDAGNTTSVAAEIVAEFNALTSALATGITASNVASVLVLTADVPGTPIYATYTGTGTWNTSGATNTPNSSPNDVNAAANWSTGVAPVDTDSVYVTSRPTDAMTQGLNQTGSTPTWALLQIEQGAPQIGTAAYPLAVKITALRVGVTPADGSNKPSAAIINISVGNTATVGDIYSTRNIGDSGRPPVQILAANASSIFRVYNSSIVGFATAIAGQTGTIGTIVTKDQAKVVCGSGLTLSVVDPEGGTTTLNAGATTVNYGPGEVIVRGAGNITTVSNGGDFTWDSSGTITTYNGQGKSNGDFWRGTVTTANLYGKDATIDASVSGIPGNATFTNPINCYAGARTKQADFGDNRAVQQSANA